MSIDPKIKTLLEDLAGRAPDPAVAVGAQWVLPRIRRRRRTHTIMIITVPICVAATVGGLVAAAAVAGPFGGDAPRIAGPRTTDDATGRATAGPGPRSPFGRCGEAAQVTRREDQPLTLTADLPTGQPTGGALDATLRIANVGKARIRGLTEAYPTVILVRDNVIVAMPAGARAAARQLDLAPGAVLDVPVTVMLNQCTDSSPGRETPGKNPVGPSADPLPPGAYQVYAAASVRPFGSDGPTGEVIEIQGGPWDLQLR